MRLSSTTSQEPEQPTSPAPPEEQPAASEQQADGETIDASDEAGIDAQDEQGQQADRTGRVTGERVTDRFGLLLLLLVGSFLTGGVGGAGWVTALSEAMLLAAIAVGFLASNAVKRPPVLYGLLLVSLAGVTLVVSSSSLNTAFGVGSGLLTLVSALLLISVLTRVLRHQTVNAQTLLGAGCVYMVIGFMFAAMYGMFDSFWSTPIFGEKVAKSVYGYFSFTTMTTVGYGDYTVKPDFVRRVANMEAVAGQLFLATTVARLVSLYSNERVPALRGIRRRRPAEEPGK